MYVSKRGALGVSILQQGIQCIKTSKKSQVTLIWKRLLDIFHEFFVACHARAAATQVQLILGDAQERAMSAFTEAGQIGEGRALQFINGEVFVEKDLIKVLIFKDCSLEVFSYMKPTRQYFLGVLLVVFLC